MLPADQMALESRCDPDIVGSVVGRIAVVFQLKGLNHEM